MTVHQLGQLNFAAIFQQQFEQARALFVLIQVFYQIPHSFSYLLNFLFVYYFSDIFTQIEQEKGTCLYATISKKLRENAIVIQVIFNEIDSLFSSVNPKCDHFLSFN